jgi:small subunit ribosomal protein S20
MPIIKSAKKKMIQDVKRTARNKVTKDKMKDSIRNVMKAVLKDPKEAEKMLPKAYSAIDVALKKNMIPKNTAARRKAKLAKAIKAAEAKSAGTAS